MDLINKDLPNNNCYLMIKGSNSDTGLNKIIQKFIKIMLI